MFPILAAIIVSSQPLPFIDRAALRVLAKAETAKPARASATRPVRAKTSLTDLCRTVDVSKPNGVSDLARTHSMVGPEVSILKTACARVSMNARGDKLASR